MASIDRIQTGVTTFEVHRGRIMRVQIQASTQPSKERRTVCVLSLAGATALTDWGIAQPCFGNCTHSHHTRDLVERLVQAGSLRWIGRGKNIAAWIAGREWRAKPSGYPAVKVMQLV